MTTGEAGKTIWSGGNMIGKVLQRIQARSRCGEGGVVTDGNMKVGGGCRRRLGRAPAFAEEQWYRGSPVIRMIEIAMLLFGVLAASSAFGCIPGSTVL